MLLLFPNAIGKLPSRHSFRLLETSGCSQSGRPTWQQTQEAQFQPARHGTNLQRLHRGHRAADDPGDHANTPDGP